LDRFAAALPENSGCPEKFDLHYLPSDAAGEGAAPHSHAAGGSVTTRRDTDDENDLDAGELGVC
jgi:hypothetical protein